MCTLFIGVWYYTIDKLSMQEMMGAIGLIINIRSFLSLGLFSFIFSWLQYKLQWQSANNLGVYFDGTMIGGTSDGQAAYRNLQLNALLASNKALLGYIIIAGLGVLLYVLMHHFGKINYRRIIFMRKIGSGKSIQGYRLGYRNTKEQDIEDVAGAVV